MTKTFIIGTVDNRIAGLLNMLISAKRYIGPWEIVIVAQHYTPEQIASVTGQCRKLFGDEGMRHIHFEFMPDYMGCFGSKMYGLKLYDSDIYLSMDDDMLILPQTDYDRMAELYVQNPDIGLMSGIYVRKREFIGKATVADKIKRQPLTGTNGGLMFGREIRNLLVEKLYGRDFLFDDLAWALTAYVHGYIQAVYSGSLIVHLVGMPGGFREWAKGDPRELPDASLIEIKRKKNGNENAIMFMGSEDLTEKAKGLYRQNKRTRNEVIA